MVDITKAITQERTIQQGINDIENVTVRIIEKSLTLEKKIKKLYIQVKGLLIILVLAINRKLLYKLQYYHQRGKFPDLKNPRDLSEKLLSEMLKPSYVIKYAGYADKVKVRNYVISKGLGEILLQHYGVWDDARQIDFEKLPDKFVLKTNNGCGGHIFCWDKKTFDKQKAVKYLNSILDLPYYYNKEPHYKAIKPLIFCEEFLDTGTNELPVDYKFLCIKGKPVYVAVYTERHLSKKVCMFDMEWNLKDYIIRQRIPKSFPQKPEKFEEMKRIAQELSEGFDFVRVDLYSHNHRILFGELTFTPSGGLLRSLTNEAIEILGALYK